MTGPGKRDDELRRRGRGRDPGRHRRVARRAGPARGDRRGRRPASSRSCSAPRSPRTRRLERVRLVGDDGAGKFGMDARGPRRQRPRQAVASPHLELLGLHAFGASNVLDAVGARRARRGHRPGRPPAGAARAGIAPPADRRRRRPRDPVRAARGVARPRAARRRPGGDRRATGRPTRSWPMRACCSNRAGSWSGRPAPTSRGSSTARPSTASIVAILDGGVHHVLRPALVGQEHRIRAFGGRGRGTGTAAGGWCR